MAIDITKVKPTCIFAKDGTGPLDKERLTNYTCPICDHILSEPMQGECGDRFCRSCLDKKRPNNFACPRCGEEIKHDEVFPDRGCKREINLLRTKCDCGNLISIADYAKHVMKECTSVKKPCPYNCNQSFSVAELEEHKKTCPMKTVKCKHCSEVVKENFLQEHYERCPEYPNECPYCNKSFDDKMKVHGHLTYECEVKKHKCFLCEKLGTMAKLEDHIDAHHNFLLIKQVENLNGIVTQMIARIENLEREKVTQSRSMSETIERQRNKIDTLQDTLKKINENQSSKISALDRDVKALKQEFLDKKTPRFDEVEKDGGPVASESITRSQLSSYDSMPHVSKSAPPSLQKESPVLVEKKFAAMQAEVISKVNQVREEMVNRTIQQETSLEYSKSEIEKIFKLLQAQDDNIMKQKNILEDVHLRQELQEVKATKGVFIWKINDLGRRKQDANDGRVLSLYSPPFFTSFHGYRMCIRCYLNGDGSGKGTHISVFFVVMKSEHDDLLPWPFKQKVTISLLNQETPADNTSHITQSFMPDAKSSSFQKPTKDMNIASGFPKFAPRSVLSDKRYAVSDTVYFKVKVDLSDIPLD